MLYCLAISIFRTAWIEIILHIECGRIYGQHCEMKYNFQFDKKNETAAFGFFFWLLLLVEMTENLLFFYFFPNSSLGVNNDSYIHSPKLELKERKKIVRKNQVKHLYRSRFETLIQKLHQSQQDHMKLII